LSTDGKAALKLLLEGNERYVSEKRDYGGKDRARRAETASGQRPFAVVLTCSDSRVPPEIIFDCGIGDIFVVRVAGNVADDLVLGSIEYAVSHLGTPLVMVLGHTSCGAVTAALEGGGEGEYTGSIVELLAPALTSRSVDEIARVNAVATASVISDSVGGCLVAAAMYDIESGRVEVIE
jgi:carbonic anhydrase